MSILINISHLNSFQQDHIESPCWRTKHLNNMPSLQDHRSLNWRTVALVVQLAVEQRSIGDAPNLFVGLELPCTIDRYFVTLYRYMYILIYVYVYIFIWICIDILNYMLQIDIFSTWKPIDPSFGWLSFNFHGSKLWKQRSVEFQLYIRMRHHNTSQYTTIHHNTSQGIIWLVVLNIFIFQYIGNHHPNWLILSEGLKPPTSHSTSQYITIRHNTS